MPHLMAEKENSGRTLLIVEDDELLLRALYITFHNSGYSIATAEDGDTAFKMTLRLKPDAVLLDLLLPKMNGFDFLKNVKADPATKPIPVIVLSNLGDQENIEKAKALGAADYFIKSNTSLEGLKNIIDKILI